MSNPFRRAHPDISAPDTKSIQPLSINTGSRPEKHVRIASPPDTAISPPSYPPSPVLSRTSTELPLPIPTPVKTSGTENLEGDPWHAGDFGEERDGLIDEALRYNRSPWDPENVDGQSEAVTVGSAVQNTLSKFASRPREARRSDENTVALQKAGAARQTMDVDAFTRLLLTGGAPQPGVASTGPAPTQNISDSSSNADSASVSRQSIFEPLQPIPADSPRSSQDLEEGYRERNSAAANVPEKSRKAPPAPKPRRGKLLNQDAQRTAPDSMGQVMQFERVSSRSDLTNKPLPPPPEDDGFQTPASSASAVDIDPSMQIKRPPTPPLSRRRSQMSSSKPQLSRSSSSGQPLTTTLPSFASSSTPSLTSKAPPPPPSRRISQRVLSKDLPSTSEELATDPMEQWDLSTSFTPLNRTTSSATRTSLTGADTPPLPPPRRRNRALSRSSIDSQGLVSLAKSNDDKISGDKRRPSADSGRSVSGSSRDILADLASLQREVDALRAQRREF